MYRLEAETDKGGVCFELNSFFFFFFGSAFTATHSSISPSLRVSLYLALSSRTSHRRICVALQHNTVMDWEGQKLSEQLMQIMLVAFAVVAFVTGYTLGSFRLMLLIYAAGVVLTTLITVPNWPFFNSHPLKWLDPIEAELHPKPQTSAPKKKPTKSHNK